MAGTAYKIVSTVIIVCLVLALLGMTGAYLNQKEQYSQVINIRDIKTDAYVLSFDSERMYNYVIRTSLTLDNRGGGGLIWVEYTAHGEEGGTNNLMTREYYLRSWHNYTFREVWIVSPGDDYVQCKIVKQITRN
jgi:hypothetical protein